MDRFWIVVYSELAKDIVCDLAREIDQGRPQIVALHLALHRLEATLGYIDRVQASMGAEPDGPILPRTQGGR